MMSKMTIRARLTIQTVVLVVLVFSTFSAVTAGYYYSWMRKDFDNTVGLSWGKKMAYFQHNNAGEVEFFHPTPSHAEAGKDSSYRTIFYEIFSSSGERLYQSKSLKGLEMENPFGAPKTSLIRDNQGLYETVAVGEDSFRVKSAPLKIGDKYYLFRVALEESEISKQILGLLKTLGVGLLFLILSAGIGSYFFVKKALRPIEEISIQAENIRVTNLGERLPISNANDEIGRLTKVLNSLLDRLDSSFEEMKRFTSDASHELRTPLTVLRITGESVLSKDSSKEELREAVAESLEETERLVDLTNSLLTLARLDRQGDRELEEFDIAEQARSLANSLGVLAGEKNQNLEVQLPKSLKAKGHESLIRQTLMNLVDNAIKYGREGGEVVLSSLEKENEVHLSIRDDGPGITLEHQEHLFKRFYRVDSDRNRKTGGYGIGLSIAQRSAELSRGRIDLQSTPGKGSCFTVVRPKT